MGWNLLSRTGQDIGTASVVHVNVLPTAVRIVTVPAAVNFVATAVDSTHAPIVASSTHVQSAAQGVLGKLRAHDAEHVGIAAGAAGVSSNRGSAYGVLVVQLPLRLQLTCT